MVLSFYELRYQYFIVDLLYRNLLLSVGTYLAVDAGAYDTESYRVNKYPPQPLLCIALHIMITPQTSGQHYLISPLLLSLFSFWVRWDPGYSNPRTAPLLRTSEAVSPDRSDCQGTLVVEGVSILDFVKTHTPFACRRGVSLSSWLSGAPQSPGGRSREISRKDGLLWRGRLTA